MFALEIKDSFSFIDLYPGHFDLEFNGKLHASRLLSETVFGERGGARGYGWSRPLLRCGNCALHRILIYH